MGHKISYLRSVISTLRGGDSNRLLSICTLASDFTWYFNKLYCLHKARMTIILFDMRTDLGLSHTNSQSPQAFMKSQEIKFDETTVK